MSAMQKTALITGGAKRVGAEIATHLAQNDYHVIIHYNNSAQEAEQLSESLRNDGLSAESIQANLLDKHETAELLDRIDHLDLLINNASIFKTDDLKTSPTENFDKYFTIHVKTPYLLTRGFANRFKTGHVINIIDTNVQKYKTDYFTYLLSKKALAEFTKMAAVELAPDVRVNGIAPGFVLPPDDLTESKIEQRLENIPLQKRGNPDNIVQGLAYLLKNKFVTGEILHVDGGEGRL